MKIKLAEALLRRKELMAKASQLHAVKQSDMAKLVVKRVNIRDDVDEVKAEVPRVSMSQITAAFDWHARQLRLVDAAIQHANWTTEVDVQDSVMADYTEELSKHDDR